MLLLIFRAPFNSCLPIRDQILQWLDDLLFHCKTPAALLEVLREFFTICRTHGLKLHAKKSKLFLLEVKWCGRLINKDGVRLDPSRVEMPEPVTGQELQQFVCAANWMRSVIPQFTSLIQPLSYTV
jgi:hypothetical protein